MIEITYDQFVFSDDPAIEEAMLFLLPAIAARLGQVLASQWSAWPQARETGQWNDQSRLGTASTCAAFISNALASTKALMSA
jgi:hypothetical protein